VPGPVRDPFRPPPGPFAAGNRGIEYGTTPGEPVRAVGAGVVVFAGPVAGRLVVSVVHPDGLRSSATGLASVLVSVGLPVLRGTPIGTAGTTVHLGVRRDGRYIDPASLWRLGPPPRPTSAVLVPEAGVGVGGGGRLP
jgi:murein DD-endopeptidase MepM/ murein hydrolase activator NlpD